MDIRIRAVVLSTEGIKTDKEISSSFGISERTLRRWKKSYKISGINGLNPSSTKPVNSSNQMPKALENRIISLKQKYPSWGARRIKHQFNLPTHWTSVHRVLKKHGLLIRVKAKPQGLSKKSS